MASRYPGSQFRVIDNTATTATVPITSTNPAAPTYMTTFKSVKGPEEIRTVSGSQFYELYGSQNDVLFSKYDQPLLQASMNINNGANLICKRAVLDSAKLANTTFGVVLTKGIDSKISLTLDNSNHISYIGFNSYVRGDTTKQYFDNSNGEFTIKPEFTKLTIHPICFANKPNTGIIKYNDQKKSIIDIIAKKSTIAGIPQYKFIPSRVTITRGNGKIPFNTDFDTYYNDNIDYSGVSSTKSLNEIFASVRGSNRFSNNTGTIGCNIENPSTENDNAILNIIKNNIYVEYLFPLFTIFDNGRGDSTKSFTISFDSASSKTLNQAIYTLKVIDYKTNRTLESIAFTIDPYTKNNSTGYTFDIESSVNLKSNQISVKMYYDSYDELVNILSDNFIDKDIFINNDAIFGHKLNGEVATAFENKTSSLVVFKSEESNIDNIDSSSTSAYYYYNDTARSRKGTSEKLLFGSDGETKTESYDDQYKKFFSGEFDYDVFNVDTLFPNFIFDANYNDATKLEIQKLAAFRGDLIAYLDMGTSGLTDNSTIISKIPVNEGDTTNKTYIRDMHCAVTSIYGDIRDPYTNKQITVTGTYQLSNAMVNHYINAFGKPFCGKGNGITFGNYIQGTINYIPKVYPMSINYTNTSEFLDGINNTYITDDPIVVNEKQSFCDAHINYGSYYNGLFTMDTEYTLNSTESEFSYINNVMLVNDLIQEIRKSCPSARYNFIDEEDLEVYEKAVTTVINAKRSKFASIKFKYVQDENSINNKIFYAALEIVFRPFAQAEIFTITALNYSTLNTNVTTA